MRGAALPASVVYAVALPVYDKKVLLLDNSQGGSLGKASSELNQTDISSGNSLLGFTGVKLSFKFKTQKFHLSMVNLTRTYKYIYIHTYTHMHTYICKWHLLGKLTFFFIFHYLFLTVKRQEANLFQREHHVLFHVPDLIVPWL